VILVVRRYTGGSTALLAATVAALSAHVFWGLWHGHYTGVPGNMRLTGLLIANSFGFAAGVTMAMGIVAWQARVLGRFSVLLPLVLGTAGAVAIKEGVSRTAFLAVPVAVIASLLVRRGTRISGLRTGLLVALAVVLIVLVPTRAGAISKWFSHGDSSVGTLTSRTLIWGELVPRALDRPVVGLGPGAPRFDPALRADFPNGRAVGQAHNSLIEALVSGGVPAAALWVAMMVAFGAFALSLDGSARMLAVAVWAVSLVFSITLGQLAGFGMPWYLLMSLLAFPRPPDFSQPVDRQGELIDAGPRARGG
jgi:O-antigen ligase